MPKSGWFKFLLPALVLWIMVGCSDNSVTPLPNNSFTGTIDGVSYTATDLEASQDTSSGLFIISGTINTDGAFLLYYKEDGSGSHPVETTGAFRDFTDRLAELFSQEPPLADTVLADSILTGLEQLLTGTEDLLSPGDCFLFYQVGRSVYYSTGGNLEITEYNNALQSISGTAQLSIVNFIGGRKTLTAVLDEIFYLK